MYLIQNLLDWIYTLILSFKRAIFNLESTETSLYAIVFSLKNEQDFRSVLEEQDYDDIVVPRNHNQLNLLWHNNLGYPNMELGSFKVCQYGVTDSTIVH